MEKYTIIGGGVIGKCLKQLMSKNGKYTSISTKSTKYLNNINVKFAKIVFLSVKPFDIVNMIEETPEIMDKNKLVISMIAGLNIDILQNKLEKEQPIIRCMPNIAISEGSGCIVCCKNNYTTENQKKEFEEILYGPKIIWTDKEEYMNSITALSGCGPAFISAIYKYFISVGTRLGLPKEFSNECFMTTIIGTNNLILKKENDNILDDIIKQVASKGGATEQGLKMLDNTNIENDIFEILKSSKEKCDKISHDLQHF